MPDTTHIHIEIDGKAVAVEPGKMIIEVADELGVHIPRFCYHKKLSIAANCRMCLVEVEKAPKELPACATPVTDGMKVFTHSKRALAAQKAVMEFLLINHPLDCPICDQGGECELQDVAMGYGSDVSRYSESKRVIKDKDIGPLIATDMTRCIYCTRCVRFGEEIAGLRELGGLGRGEHTEIGTAIAHSMRSELSGNIIDLCPVGALTSKPFRFRARPWELKQFSSIAPHDCIGSNIYVHARGSQVMRVVPQANESLNENWLSDRDRFSYLGLESEDRVGMPRIKRNGIWEETDWQTALKFTADGLARVIQADTADQIAALVSPNSTVEECFLLQKFLRALGCLNIDHRLRQIDIRDQECMPRVSHLSIPFASLENQDAIFIIGANVNREQPLLGHRIRKANLRGAAIIAVNSLDYAFNFDLAEKIIAAPTQLPKHLAGIAKALIQQKPEARVAKQATDLLAAIHPDKIEQAIAKQLLKSEKTAVLLGAVALHHPEAATLRALAQLISQILSAAYGELTEGANAAGASLAGALPHRAAAGSGSLHLGESTFESLQKGKKAFVLLGVEPELDCYHAGLALERMQQAEFVVALNTFASPTMLEYADVILPIAPFTETSGTYINMEGKWQSFTACVQPFAEVRPAWKVLRVLGNFFELNGFDHESSEAVLAELKSLLMKQPPQEIGQWYCPKELLSDHTASTPALERITEWAIYSGDGLVRRATALQTCATQEKAAVYINSDLAKSLKLKEGEMVLLKQDNYSATLPVKLDPRIPTNTVLTYGGMTQTSHLGAAFGAIEIQAIA